MIHKLDEACCAQSAGLMTYRQVLDLIHGQLVCVADRTSCPLEQALGRVLAEDVIAPHNIPPFNNSAIDGYAFAHASIGRGQTRLKITAEIFAGGPAGMKIGAGEAARIYTGAVMPEGADTCLMQEDAVIDGDMLVVPAGVRAGANTRLAGEDVNRGDCIVSSGVRLRASELGAIASAGKAKIEVRRRLKVALVSTGDEVIRPGSPIRPGQIYDANLHLLGGLLNRPDLEVDDHGVLADDREAVYSTLLELSNKYDIILTSGGVSVGEADFVVEAMQRLGVLHSWKVAMKPGRPIAIGEAGQAVFFGLPGNPVAAFITCLLFVLPMLDILSGANSKEHQRYLIPSGFDITTKKTGRREFLRGWLEQTAKGPVVMKFPRDGSGLISGLTRATGLIELEEDKRFVKKGEPVSFIPFSEFCATL